MFLLRMVLLGAVTATKPGVPQGRLEEYQFKAKYLGFTAYYTTFPARADPSRPWVIGVLGRSPFGRHLSDAFTPETTIRGRAVVLRFPQTEVETAEVDVLFICGSEQHRVREILAWVRGRPILTVGDTPGYGQQGVMVNFFLEQSFVRMEVNLPSARQAGLDFNSSFLKHSRLITPGGTP